MPRGKDVKVWNEDLANALKARQELSIRNLSQQQYIWGKGHAAIVAVRKDIYCFSNGRVVNLPNKLGKTVLNLCMDIIRGTKAVYPDGYFESVAAGPYEKSFDDDPYLKNLKSRSGPYAIMRAFDDAGVDTLTKDRIIEIGQQYCDTQMDANYMAGRSYGAWSSNATLIDHGLLILNGNRRYVEGVGFRSEKNKYTLTRDGQKFLEAMKRKFPKDFVGGGGAVSRGATASRRPAAGLDTAAMSPFESPAGGRLGGRGGFASPGAVARRAGRLGAQDEEELRRWVEVSDVGDEKVFTGGKDRRQHLHNACGALEQEIPGLRLEHQSRGEKRKRTLHITILRKGGADASLTAARAHGKRPAGGTFDDTPPTKHARKVPASVAAANAAEARLAKQQAVKKEEDELELALKASMQEQTVRGTPPLGNSGDEYDGLDEAIQQSLAASERKPAARPKHNSLDSTDDLYASSDEDEAYKRAVQLSLQESSSPTLASASVGVAQTSGERSLLDSKPPAKRKLFPSKKQEAVEVLSIDESDDDDDDELLLSPKSPVPSPPAKKAKGEPEVLCIDDDDEEPEVIEIEESQESILFSNESQSSVVVLDNIDSRQKCTKSFRSSTKPQLTILIDNRERNKNLTPRELRMQLTRIVTSGPIHGIWPSTMPMCRVEEDSLSIGDFVFEVGHDDVTKTKRLAVAVERKRVGDLVHRSVDGDHWNQFLRMRDSMHHSVFLIEHDTRSADGFRAYGSQNLDGWNPFGTLIDDEKAVFLFFGRAILSSRSTKFIQSGDEQASLRAIGALGVMAALSDDENLLQDSSSRTTPSDGPTAFKDKLIASSIPWQLARDVSKHFHSLKYAKACYEECANEQCCSRLLAPFISETTFGTKKSTKEGWSEAIYRALMSDPSDASAVKLQFEDHRLLVDDHGRFLCELLSGTPLQEAIDAAEDLKGPPVIASNGRKVHIEIHEKQKDLFPHPSGECFFELHLTARSPLNLPINTVIMRTEDGCHTSDRLFVHMLPAKALVSTIKSSMPAPGGNYVAASKDIASQLNNDCRHETMKYGRDRRVVLLCGLNPALNAVAKQPGYRTEMRALVDLVLAELMLCHDVVVIQAVRLTGDNEMILQQLALACFHYHMLPNQK